MEQVVGIRIERVAVVVRELHVAVEGAREGAELGPVAERLFEMANGLLLDFFTTCDPIGSQSHCAAEFIREVSA